MRRALLTSVSQVTQRISEQNAEQLGADGWEISAHAGARPSHAIYQGRQYPAKDYETIVRPLIEDYNCRHSAFPIILGISEPVYTEKQLAEIDPPPFTYEGKTYTAYEASQQMRKMERVMRRQKNICITADAAGDEETFTTASIRLRRQKDIYEDFCQKAGQYTQYERTYVAGYNRHLAGKTGAVTRKQNEFKQAQMEIEGLDKKGVDNSTKSGIIKKTTNAVGHEVLIVDSSDVKTTGEPNTITQTQNKKGGINRNYYGANGIQTKQISNNDHGNKAESKFGKHGEHGHDYFVDEDGKTKHGKGRELTDEEREENGDIL